MAAVGSSKTMMRLRPAVASRAPTASSPSILDFLVPFYASGSGSATFSTRPSCTHAPSPYRIAAASRAPTPSGTQHRTGTKLLSTTQRQCAEPLPLSHAPCILSLQRQRWFSTTGQRPQTHTLFNPQLDDSGVEMKLEITDRAAQRLTKVMEKDGNPRLALRIQVESGGCHGFQYVMSLVTLPEQLPGSSAKQQAPTDADGDASAKTETYTEPVIREDDTIFTYAPEGATDGDSLLAPKIILDTPSLELLNGSKVDFTMELIGSQFKIVDNPAATSSCGCGTSFDIKI